MMISISHWGMFVIPPRRRITDRETLPVLHKYRPMPTPMDVRA